MNVGSLFSGIGGIDLGLERAGMRVAFQCESDQWRRTVLTERFGRVVFPDVRSLRPEGLPRVDILAGGFPCQDVSVAGRQAGLYGSRTALFFDFCRLADALIRPGGWLVLENVPGLFSSNSGRDFAVVRATLADLGFLDGAWRVLDSRYLGVPQRRRRVFVLARRARGRRAAEVLLEPESGGGSPAAYSEAGQDHAGTLGGGSGSRGWSSDTDRMTFVPEIARTLRQDPGGVGNAWNTTYVPEVAAPLTKGSAASPGVNDPGRRKEDDSNVIAFYPGEARMAGESWDDVSPTLKVGSGLGIASPPAIAFFSENQRAEVRETDFAFSLTNGGGKPGQGYPAVRVGAAVRRLTPRECERLQGFPDDWTALGADNKRYAALGDAVTVNVAQWIGKRLLEVNGGS